jgi:hypothetical protein
VRTCGRDEPGRSVSSSARSWPIGGQQRAHTSDQGYLVAGPLGTVLPDRSRTGRAAGGARLREDAGQSVPGSAPPPSGGTTGGTGTSGTGDGSCEGSGSGAGSGAGGGSGAGAGSGAGGGCAGSGPAETTIVTVEPSSTCVPVPGLTASTVPAGLASNCSDTAGVRPAAAIAPAAASRLLPTRPSGTTPVVGDGSSVGSCVGAGVRVGAGGAARSGNSLTSRPSRTRPM